jgi:hypothetical protein
MLGTLEPAVLGGSFRSARRSVSASANVGHGTRQVAHEPLAAQDSHPVVKKWPRKRFH